ncbi:MAG TPA: carboxyl transferase domain-containing protein [Caulobacteraceae bacterium]|jgi:acetyl/propionyl-CoA carboxylase alpha subunit/acetyl-CoA carboxylase carboxyltransferase component|nr:carboxyl transferase domain-containing protein [Caulobacteraceae bacterium]
MSFSSLLIANRGEIAIRIARAAAEAGLETVSVYSKDDATSLHVEAADVAMPLDGVGPRAYLDAEAIIAAAREAGAQAVHPGYGFLAESAAFARACAQANLIFVGPPPEALEIFGDKVKARALAERQGVPVLPGTRAGVEAAELEAFFDSLPRGSAMMIKAAAGGGGRGMRLIRAREEIAEAAASASREAEAAFGDGDLYGELLVERARHIEVQVAGDRTGVLALGERDCSIQRRRQKIIEIAPAPGLSDALRARLWDAAATLAAAARYRSLGTVEFLLQAGGEDFWFIEANARLQVEHTITEESLGIDLVQIQLALATGATIASLGLSTPPRPSRTAVQARVNLETLSADGEVQPAAGVITAYEPPSGPGVRVDGYGWAGYRTSPNFDSLLAKVIAAAPSLNLALARCERALSEFRFEGVENNIGLLRALLAEPALAAGEATTRFVDQHAARLVETAAALPTRTISAPPPIPASAGPVIAAPARPAAPAGAVVLAAPLQATVGRFEVEEGALVRRGQTLAILEAMKMEHVLTAPEAGRVGAILAAPGAVVGKDEPLVFLFPEDVDHAQEEADEAVDLDFIRPDLAAVEDRWRITGDEARPEAVERRRNRNQRTVRENIDDLVDPGSFLEYGAFALAGQRRRRTEDELKKMSPADGLVCGIGSVNGALFPSEKARCAALAYDFTVLAGTQGGMNHRKTDRLLEVVETQELPVVWYAEGGGGRPGDTDGVAPSGLATPSFKAFAKLIGKTPKIAIVSGRCFAGNASFAGMSDILICTRGANIGMGGPAMIEGGGLGVFTPEEIGPMEVQTRNGVVDILADDEAHATALAKQTLAIAQGPLADWSAPDQRALRRAIPENRLRVYDIRAVIETLADAGSFIELRPEFAPGVITGFIRLEGRPMALIANDPKHLGGAVDCDGADKGSRLFQLADAWDLPVLSLVDTPGFMVGPDSEAQAAVRKTSRLFINGATLGTPMFAVVLRKAYGLGAQAMTGGSTLAPVFCVAWPTGEFGGMGLEGSVRLGYRRELEAETDPAAKQALFDKLLGGLYDRGKAINVASMLEIDAVIDPADTRDWIVRGLRSCPPRHAPKRRFLDAW